MINPSSDIHTLNVGETRKMILRRKYKDGNILAEEVDLPENSLLTFSRKSHDYFAHEIPADVNVDKVRYSLIDLQGYQAILSKLNLSHRRL